MVAAWILVALLGPPMALTAAGQYRRGHLPLVPNLVLAVIAAIGFPVAWVAWYVVDERPWQRYLGPG